jgi:hypothetical protein
LLDVASSICFEANEDYEVAVGNPGFATQWICMAQECTRTTQFQFHLFFNNATRNENQSLVFGRTQAHNFESYYFHNQDDTYNPCDEGQSDSGTCEEGDELVLDMGIRVTKEEYDSTNLPAWNEPVRMK